jgi:hypothetical protein
MAQTLIFSTLSGKVGYSDSAILTEPHELLLHLDVCDQIGFSFILPLPVESKTLHHFHHQSRYVTKKKLAIFLQ